MRSESPYCCWTQGGGGGGGGFHERALTDSGFFEERFFFGSINFCVSLDSIVVSVPMPITSLFF